MLTEFRTFVAVQRTVHCRIRVSHHQQLPHWARGGGRPHGQQDHRWYAARAGPCSCVRVRVLPGQGRVCVSVCMRMLRGQGQVRSCVCVDSAARAEPCSCVCAYIAGAVPQLQSGTCHESCVRVRMLRGPPLSLRVRILRKQSCVRACSCVQGCEWDAALDLNSKLNLGHGCCGCQSILMSLSCLCRSLAYVALLLMSLGCYL